MRIFVAILAFFTLSHPAFAQIITPPGYTVNPPPVTITVTAWPTNNAELVRNDVNGDIILVREDFGDYTIPYTSPPIVDAEGFYLAADPEDMSPTDLPDPGALYPGYDINGVHISTHSIKGQIFTTPKGDILTNLQNPYESLQLDLIEDPTAVVESVGGVLPNFRPPHIFPPNNPGEPSIKSTTPRRWDFDINTPVRHTGLYLFTRGGKMGVITHRNQVVIRAYFDSLSNPAEPNGNRIATVNGKQGIIDRGGRWVQRPIYATMSEPQYYQNSDREPVDMRGLRRVSVSTLLGATKFGMMDLRGFWVIPPRFDSLSNSPDVNGNWQISITNPATGSSADGIVDRDGRWVVYPRPRPYNAGPPVVILP